MMTYEQIIRELKSMSDSDLVDVHNKYCETMGYYDDTIYENDKYFLDEHFSCPSELARAICYGEYDYTDDYVMFDGYGNLKTFDNVTNHAMIEDIADYVADMEDEDEQEDFLNL